MININTDDKKKWTDIKNIHIDYVKLLLSKKIMSLENNFSWDKFKKLILEGNVKHTKTQIKKDYLDNDVIRNVEYKKIIKIGIKYLKDFILCNTERICTGNRNDLIELNDK